METDAPTRRIDLTPAIRSSLQAKLERLLARPMIAAVPSASPHASSESRVGGPDVFRALQLAAQDSQPSVGRSGQGGAWAENSDDGTCVVRIEIDYDDLWRGCEKEIVETVRNTVESPVTFLTSEQKTLLERSPREFLALNPRPESAELISYRTEYVGGSERVTELTLAAPPASPIHIRHIAIVPNLVQIERQLDALETVERAADDGPLAPLRALVGLCGTPSVAHSAGSQAPTAIAPAPGERLDEFQAECIAKAMSTPHFAVIHGPPGSGKTTVITSVIQRVVARGDRVLVVSPTHVAVDNVVEKLVPTPEALVGDRLEPHTLPVRYSARKNRLSERAMEYWVGSKRQLRGATISRRLQHRLTAHLPIARSLFASEDANSSGTAPLSASIAAVEKVICGTPIGILSYAKVKAAAPGEFDLLIVDEVSKMTLSEFLAIAVKAKRWVLVGDPQQLPPYNNSEENGPTLDDVLNAQLELVCSVGAILERAKPYERRAMRLVVVATEPSKTVSAIQSHVSAVNMESSPPVATLDECPGEGIVVCSLGELDAACAALSPLKNRDRSHAPDQRGELSVLVERGLRVPRPDYASGTRLVEGRYRCQALIFENAFNVYHAQPWSERAAQKLAIVRFRNGLEKYLPSLAAVAALNGHPGAPPSADVHRTVRGELAARYAVNTVSVYDWLTCIPARCFDVSPLLELGRLSQPGLCEAVRPFVGILKQQYRMHPSLSQVPRELFYYNEALHDGKTGESADCRVVFVQVPEGGDAGTETNSHECDRICRLLADLNTRVPVQDRKPNIMVITPYRDQKAMLADAINGLRERGQIDRLDVDAYTLDSCQGREAEYVLISLVRSRATPFFDMPKRWNVALTRAMLGLFIVGNIDAYLREAADARRHPRSQPREGGGPARPLMSLLARILEAYDRQIAEHRRGHA